MQGKAVLFSEMTPDLSWEEDFNDWYDREHIPLRMGVPGFQSAQRYIVPQTSNYLAVYEMDSPGVLRTAAYQSVKNNPSERTRRMLAGVTGFTRYIAEEISEHRRRTPHPDFPQPLNAPYLYAVFSKVPFGPEEENDWLMTRHFRIVDGEPKLWTHLTLHYLANDRAIESLFSSAGSVYQRRGSRQYASGN